MIVSIASADGGGSRKAGWKSGKSKKVTLKTSGTDTGLIGIKLYDDGLRVIQLYGSPDEIRDVANGGGSIGPVGQRGAGPTAGGPPTGGGRSGGGGGGGSAASAMWERGWDFGNQVIEDRQGRPQAAGASGGGGGSRGGGGGAVPGGGGGPSGGGGTTAPTDTGILYTRWIYKRGPSRYGFVIDKHNHVVQIEAIGSGDPKVNTARGVRFGSSFADIIRRYGTPDSYEISGDSVVVKYLVTNKVAFRLNRLQPNKPHQVTAIAVAGGKD